MTVDILQVNMSRGEITPLAHGRVDTDHYQAGLEEARNVVVLRYGGVTRAPGTIYGGAVKTAAKKTRFLPFAFNTEQTYFIEAGETYFRFWTKSGMVIERIEVVGVPVEVATPYLEDDLANIKLRQVGDQVYLFCQGYQPRVLTRSSETSWALALYTPLDGPYLDVNTTSTTLTPAATGAVHPIMTSNTLPSGTAASNTAAIDAFEVFDAVKSTTWINSASNEGWISYDFPSTGTKVCDAYWIRAVPNANPDGTPVAWEFQGYTGSVWVTLDSRQGEAGWSRGEVRFYDFQNETAYQSYRLIWSGTNTSSDDDSRIGEMGWHEAGDSQTPFNLTASSTTGINDGTGFVAADVGRPIRLYGSDGRWRWAQIAARSSSTVVTIRLYGHALPDLSPIANWQLGVWSDQTGWPRAVALFEDRLIGGGSDDDPTSIAGSRNGDYDNYGLSNVIVDDDGISMRLTGGQLNQILWLLENGDDLVAGTSGSIRVVTRQNPQEAFGPNNHRQRSPANVSVSSADPLTVENIILFIDGLGQRIYETAFDYNTDKYLARELTTMNEHLFNRSPIEQIVYQSHPHRIMWCRRADGKLVAATYDRDQKVFGCSLVDFNGVVEDICVLPGALSRDVMMVVRRTVGGSTVRYVEAIADFYTDAAATSQTVPIFGTSALVYSGSSAGTVTGAAHLNGKTVGVLVDGFDAGDATVSGGSVTVPGGLEGETIVIGERMGWNVKTLRLEQYGQRDGSGLGRPVQIVSGKIDLYQSAGLEVGTVDGTDVLMFEDEVEEDPYDPPASRTGAFPLMVDDSWSNNGQLVVGGSRMYPVTIRGISLRVDGEP